MKKVCFAVIPDIQLGREKIIINPWDKWYYNLRGIPIKNAVVGKEISRRLERAVEVINSHYRADFIVSIGDITDSAAPEQLEEAKKILSRLSRPFIPMLGNHDVWPYLQKFEGKKKRVVWEAERPLIVKEFEAYFKDWKNSCCFKNFEKQGGQFQNYAFTINGVRFVVADNNNRRKAPFGLPGQAGWAKLHPESYKWLMRQVSSSKEEKIIIFSHAPLKKGLLKKLQRKIGKKVVNIAGHLHKKSKWEKQNVMQVITNALYHEPLILFVKVGKEIEYEYRNV